MHFVFGTIMNQCDLFLSALRRPVAAAAVTLALTVGVASPSSADGSANTTSASNRSITLGNGPTDATCLQLPSSKKGFGSLSKDDWSEWKDDVRFASNNHFLQLPGDSDGQPILRHKFVPSSVGTDRTIMGADLPEARTYRLTQSLMFEPGFEWGGTNRQGGKIGFGLSGGTSPTGGTVDPEGFSARLMWRGNNDGEVDGSATMVIYSYASDRHYQTGEDYRMEGFEVPIGEWFNVTMEITLNSNINSADGKARAWINGELVLVKAGIAWQSAGDKPVIDNLYYSSFYGGDTSEWSPSKTTYASVRDVCWAAVIDGISGIDPDNDQYNTPSLGTTGDSSIDTGLDPDSDLVLDVFDYRSYVASRLESISSSLQSMIEEDEDMASFSLQGGLTHLQKARAQANWSTETKLNPSSPRLLNLDHATNALIQAADIHKSLNRPSHFEESLAFETESIALEVLDRLIGQLQDNLSDSACATSPTCSTARGYLDKAIGHRAELLLDGYDMHSRIELANNSWIEAAKALNLLAESGIGR